MVTLSDEHALALTMMTRWFRGMIVDRNIGTPGLTAEYLMELEQALKAKDGDMIFYPHYCNDCHKSFVSKDRLARCWNCGSGNTVNCYGEKYINIQKEKQE